MAVALGDASVGAGRNSALNDDDTDLAIERGDELSTTAGAATLLVDVNNDDDDDVAIDDGALAVDVAAVPSMSDAGVGDDGGVPPKNFAPSM